MGQHTDGPIPTLHLATSAHGTAVGHHVGMDAILGAGIPKPILAAKAPLPSRLRNARPAASVRLLQGDPGDPRPPKIGQHMANMAKGLGLKGL